ncbi:MAG: hypothetical protein WC227_01070 [Patescibacteria group bacterium]|jgi:hypothetical protein
MSGETKPPVYMICVSPELKQGPIMVPAYFHPTTQTFEVENLPEELSGYRLITLNDIMVGKVLVLTKDGENFHLHISGYVFRENYAITPLPKA